MTCKATHDAIQSVLVWSFEAMALGVLPTDGPLEQEYKSKLAGQVLTWKAAVVEWRGDWKMLHD
eukprot:5594359-Amphidinium_carterae.1